MPPRWPRKTRSGSFLCRLRWLRRRQSLVHDQEEYGSRRPYRGTITIYDADGNASSVDVTVTQEGAPVTGSMIYEGDNALDAVMMNVNGEYVSWVLRKDADEIVTR